MDCAVWCGNACAAWCGLCALINVGLVATLSSTSLCLLPVFVFHQALVLLCVLVWNLWIPRWDAWNVLQIFRHGASYGVWCRSDCAAWYGSRIVINAGDFVF